MARFIALVAAIIIIVSVGGCNKRPRPADPPRPGNPAVYQRIAAETDCKQLQTEFDNGETTSKQGAQWTEIGISYMQAADKRMRQVGCYKHGKG